MILQVFGRPDQPLKPLVVVVKALVGVFLGLGGKEQEGPVAAFHQEKLPGQLAQNAAATLIDLSVLIG